MATAKANNSKPQLPRTGPWNDAQAARPVVMGNFVNGDQCEGFLRPYPSIWVVRYSLHLFFWIICICGIWVVCLTCYFRATCVCLVLFELSFCSPFETIAPAKMQVDASRCRSWSNPSSIFRFSFHRFHFIKKTHVLRTSTSPDTSSGWHWWHWWHDIDFWAIFYSDQTNCPLVNPKMFFIVREFPSPKCQKHSGLGVIQ